MKINNIGDGIEEQLEFIGNQKKCQTGESKRFSRGDSTEHPLNGM